MRLFHAEGNVVHVLDAQGISTPAARILDTLPCATADRVAAGLQALEDGGGEPRRDDDLYDVLKDLVIYAMPADFDNINNEHRAEAWSRALSVLAVESHPDRRQR